MSARHLLFLGGFALLIFVFSACSPISAPTSTGNAEVYPADTGTEIQGVGDYSIEIAPSDADGREDTIWSCGPFTIVFPDGSVREASPVESGSNMIELPSGSQCELTHAVHLGAGKILFPPSMNQNPPSFVTFDEERFPVGTLSIRAPATTMTWHRIRGWMVDPIRIIPLQVSISTTE